MGIRKSTAEVISTVSSAVLRHVFRRPAGNFPGKVALYVDPRIIADTAGKLRRGSICVVGTNGKTTVSNMVADCVEAAGQVAICNRGGANLDSGVATTLLQAKQGDWGVFECDELWLGKILPQLRSRYVLLLNLFRDQLDRVGEIDRIQESIAEALRQSPRTVLLYNADDPHCEKIARMVENPSVPFGMGEGLSGVDAAEHDATMCQECESMLAYEYRSYGQLGAYACPTCSFARPHLKFMARNCHVDVDGLAFDVVAAVDDRAVGGGTLCRINAPFSGAYMFYNLLAVYTAGHLLGIPNESIQETVGRYNQHNGRLERMDVHGRSVLLNLAKNPTGFDQNIAMAMQEKEPLAIAFFVNDMEGDGRDVSWIWDVNFEQLANRPDTVVYVGGMRGNDLQVRLKYAGLSSVLVENATDVMCRVQALPESYRVFMVANYTSLPNVREECVAMQQSLAAPVPTSAQLKGAPDLPKLDISGDPLRIVHVYPELLNINGDNGNVAVLRKRCEWRGIPVEVNRAYAGTVIDFANADIVVMGGGPEREQRLACETLASMKDVLLAYVEQEGVLLATGGGYSLLATSWFAGDSEVPGLGILPVHADQATKAQERIVGDIALESSLATMPIVGYENHTATVVLDENAQPFGAVLGKVGTGNNARDGQDGVIYRNAVASFAHGPLLGKNPEVADWLIVRALERKGVFVELAPLDDTIEVAANNFMRKRLGV